MRWHNSNILPNKYIKFENNISPHKSGRCLPSDDWREDLVIIIHKNKESLIVNTVVPDSPSSHRCFAVFITHRPIAIILIFFAIYADGDEHTNTETKCPQVCHCQITPA